MEKRRRRPEFSSILPRTFIGEGRYAGRSVKSAFKKWAGPQESYGSAALLRQKWGWKIKLDSAGKTSSSRPTFPCPGRSRPKPHA